MANNQLQEFNFAKDTIPENVRAVIDEYFSIESEEARRTKTINFMARALVIATMPHKDPKSDIYTRTNGDFTLRMMAGSSNGLPFASYPRLLMSWITSEAIRTKSPEIYLGESLGNFLKFTLDLSRGSANRRLIDQMTRLFGTHITAVTRGSAKRAPIRLNNVVIAEDVEIYPEEVRQLWTPQEENAGKWQSKILLNSKFFNELITCPVPIDITAFKALRKTPLAMDLYSWLTFRYSYLEKPTTIPWESLQNQFGSNYPFTVKGKIDFKKGLLSAIGKVRGIYDGAKFEVKDAGLTLFPSKPHISKIAFDDQKKLF